MANIGSLTATLGVDTRALAKAERTFRGVMGRMKNEVFSLKGALIALSGAFALHELKKGILDVTHLAGRYVELGIAMKTAGENAGFSADQMLAFQKSVESMGIAAIEARQTLLRMSVAGIDLSRSMELARAAQDLAVVGAINSSEAFERLIYGIQTGQVRILRTIGLNLTFEEGYTRLAKEIGKTTNELTEQEKMQSRVNAVLKEAVKFQGLYEDAMTSAEKQFRSLKRHIDNFKVAFGLAFQPAYLKIVEFATTLFKRFKDIVADPTFQVRVQQIAGKVTDVITILVENIIGKFTSLKDIFVKENFGRIAAEGMLKLVHALKAVALVGAAASDSMRGISLIIQGILMAINKMQQVEYSAQIDELKRLEGGYEAHKEEIIALEDKISGLKDTLEKSKKTWMGMAMAPLAMTTVSKTMAEIDKNIAELEGKWKAQDKVANDTINTMQKVVSTSKQGTKEIGSVADAMIKSIADSATAAANTTMDIAKADEIRKNAEAQINTIKGVTKEAQNAIDLATDKERESIQDLMSAAEEKIKEASQVSGEEASKVATIWGSVIAKAVMDAEQNIKDVVTEQKKLVQNALRQTKETDNQAKTMSFILDGKQQEIDLSDSVLQNYTHITGEQEKTKDELDAYNKLLDETIKKERALLRIKEAQSRVLQNATGGAKSHEGGTSLPYTMSEAKGGIIPSFQGGGIMGGYSSKDKYLAAFRGGEAFISPERVQQAGKDTVQSIIDGTYQKPAERIVWDIRTGDGSYPVVVEKSDTFNSLLAELRKQELVAGD